MGLILDSSVIVAAERRHQNVDAILNHILSVFGETEVGLSVVTIVELTHAIARAKIEVHRQRHQAFVADLKQAVQAYPVTLDIAERAGTISGQAAEHGITMPFEDCSSGRRRFTWALKSSPPMCGTSK